MHVSHCVFDKTCGAHTAVNGMYNENAGPSAKVERIHVPPSIDGFYINGIT
tara:strand:+ start:4222 stop:4374 length:153 start_codon:yes stop_codon:yes gene_type:complete